MDLIEKKETKTKIGQKNTIVWSQKSILRKEIENSYVTSIKAQNGNQVKMYRNDSAVTFTLRLQYV